MVAGCKAQAVEIPQDIATKSRKGQEELEYSPMPHSYSAELSTFLCWKAPVDHGNNPANHLVWYDLENFVLFVAQFSLQRNAARLIKCSQLTVQAIS